jgi:Flp pilus assembly protein TadD
MTADEAADMAIADLLRQGMLHHREGRLSEAERAYRDVLRREPTNPQGLHLLGALEGQRGRLPIALELLRRAAARDPNDAHIQNNLGETLRHLGRHGEAIRTLRMRGATGRHSSQTAGIPIDGSGSAISRPICADIP